MDIIKHEGKMKTTEEESFRFTEEEKELIKQTIAKNQHLTDSELALFGYVAKKSGLDPFAKQIYCVKFTNQETGQKEVQFITGIDGYRAIAEKTGKYAGGDDYLFDEGLTIYQMLEKFGKDKDKSKVIPRTATCTVYKVVQGVKVGTTATVRWSERYPRMKSKQWFWNNNPFGQLGKCLPGRQCVQTDEGTYRIADIVNNRKKLKVRSLNLQTNQIEWKEIIGWYENGGNKEWIRLHIHNGKKGTNDRILTTPDHLFLVDKESNIWKKASELNLLDKIYVKGRKLNDIQEQVLIGSLFGDGNLSKFKTPHFNEAHSIKQREYLIWKKNCFSNFDPYLNENDKTINFSTKSDVSFTGYRRIFYPNGKKILPKQLLYKVDDLGLAVWIMDDGGIYVDKRTKIKSKTLKLFTYSFTKIENEMIVQWMNKKYNVNPSIKRHGGYYLYFNKSDSIKILNALSDYIIFKNDKKIWRAKDISVNDNFIGVETDIKKIERHISTDSEGKYDITVKDNHNFLVNNIVIHNCAEALALRRAFPNVYQGILLDIETDNIGYSADENQDNVELVNEVYELYDVIGLNKAGIIARNISHCGKSNIETMSLEEIEGLRDELKKEVELIREESIERERKFNEEDE